MGWGTGVTEGRAQRVDKVRSRQKRKKGKKTDTSSVRATTDVISVAQKKGLEA